LRNSGAASAETIKRIHGARGVLPFDTLSSATLLGQGLLIDPGTGPT